VPTVDSKPLRSGHAPVNGINMYYEVHGRKDGIPLVLLHGGGSTIEVTFSKVLGVFAGSRRVIALRCSGEVLSCATIERPRLLCGGRTPQ